MREDQLVGEWRGRLALVVSVVRYGLEIREVDFFLSYINTYPYTLSGLIHNVKKVPSIIPIDYLKSTEKLSGALHSVLKIYITQPAKQSSIRSIRSVYYI